MYYRYVIAFTDEQYLSDLDGGIEYQLKDAYMFETYEEAMNHTTQIDEDYDILILKLKIKEETIVNKNIEVVQFCELIKGYKND